MSSIRRTVRSVGGFASLLAAALLVVPVVLQPARGDVFTPITHARFQAVVYDDPLTAGDPAWPGGNGQKYPIQLTGVVINNPCDMLDSSNDASSPQWQVFVQATAGGDYGGTALYMRKFGFGAGNQYTSEQWTAEMNRLNHPDGISPGLQKGDLINVYARAPGLFYNGKYNVNEMHTTLTKWDFDIEVVQRGLTPLAAAIALSDLKDLDDNFIFDGTRLTGGEHYQGSLVHLDNLLLDDPQNWALNGTVKVRQGELTLDMKLGLDPDLALIDASLLTTTPFSVTAILDQEDASQPFTGGYRLWLTNADDFRAVPEPSTVVLAVIGGLLLYPIVRRKGVLRTR